MFSTLRQEEAELVPPFALSRRVARRRPVIMAPWLTAAAALLLVVATGTWFLERSGSPDARVEIATLSLPYLDLWTAVWSAPSDFLLDTPGAGFLSSVPELGPGSLPTWTATAKDGSQLPDSTIPRRRIQT